MSPETTSAVTTSTTPPTTDLGTIREQVRQAVNLEWPAFEARHPALAAVLDQQVIVDATATRLADDPDYQKALSAAAAAEQSAATIIEIARGGVRGWLERLLL